MKPIPRQPEEVRRAIHPPARHADRLDDLLPRAQLLRVHRAAPDRRGLLLQPLLDDEIAQMPRAVTQHQRCLVHRRRRA